jgi:succinyl-diaminopimelate desuccinylase
MMESAEILKRQEALTREIASRRDDLVALTQDLIRIPTLNPPGDFYRDICEYLARRLEKSGFDVKLLRAEGTPGDSERHPRWNVICPPRRRPVGSLRSLQLPYRRGVDRRRLDL